MFLSTTFLLNFPITDDMEGSVGLDFALWPQKNSTTGEINPKFLLPVNLGLNFIFDEKQPHFYIGIGLSPVFRIYPAAVAPDTSLRFYMGPFAKAGLRLQVHEMMNWYIEFQQDLSIGPPAWINTATRVYSGINFRFLPPQH
jgi:hypothetical protein